MKKIVATDIRKSFSDSKCATLPVVGGISFTVADDEFVAIVGPSGQGLRIGLLPFSVPGALMNMRMRTELLRIIGKERHTVLLITHDDDEAIYMADHVLVLSPCPMTIQASFRVDMRHLRKLPSPELQDLREAILRELGM